MLENYESPANMSRLKSDVFSTHSQDMEMMVDVPDIDNADGDEIDYNDEGNQLASYGDNALETLGSSRRSSTHSRRTHSVESTGHGPEKNIMSNIEA